MEKEKKKMNKYVKLGIALFGGLLIIGLVLFLVLHDHLNKNDSGNKIGEENTPVVSDFLPSDTENLLNSYDAIVTSNVTLDRIDFVSDLISSSDEVSVYVYSSPKLVGNFKVQEENGSMYIEGLESILKTMNLEVGTHHLVLTFEKQILGYVEITIPEEFKTEVNEEDPDTENSAKNNSSNENTSNTKTETKVETENISYGTEEVSEVNMKRGERRVTQAGQVGKKEITYQITYDENGKEISREKISEKIVVSPVNEKVSVGSSDYNINTDTYVNYAGPLCTALDTTYNTCVDEDDFTFTAISIGGEVIITCIDSRCSSDKVNVHLNASWYPNSALLQANYNGETRYFFTNKASDKNNLTMDICNKYGLACGSW